MHVLVHSACPLTAQKFLIHSQKENILLNITQNERLQFSRKPCLIHLWSLGNQNENESKHWHFKGRQLLLSLVLKFLYLQKHFLCPFEMSLQQPWRIEVFCYWLCLFTLPSKIQAAGVITHHRGRMAVWQCFRNGGAGLE